MWMVRRVTGPGLGRKGCRRRAFTAKPILAGVRGGARLACATKCVLKLANGGIRSLPAMASWTEWEAQIGHDEEQRHDPTADAALQSTAPEEGGPRSSIEAFRLFVPTPARKPRMRRCKARRQKGSGLLSMTCGAGSQRRRHRMIYPVWVKSHLTCSEYQARFGDALDWTHVATNMSAVMPKRS